MWVDCWCDAHGRPFPLERISARAPRRLGERASIRTPLSAEKIETTARTNRLEAGRRAWRGQMYAKKATARKRRTQHAGTRLSSWLRKEGHATAERGRPTRSEKRRVK